MSAMEPTESTANWDWPFQKWSLSDSTACECEELEKTAEHIVTTCHLYRPPSEAGLFDVGPVERAWLHNIDVDI